MNMFDTTTLSIAAPNTILAGLMLARAYKANCYPWPSQPLDIAASKEMRSELITYATCSILGAAVFDMCCAHLNWNFNLPAADLAIFSALTNMAIAFSVSFLILCLRQVHLFKTTPTHEKAITYRCQFFLSLGILTTAVLLTLPIVQMLAINFGLSAQSAYVMKDVFRVMMALSAIPLSIGAIAVAFFRSPTRIKQV